MKISAAVVREHGGPFRIEPVELATPQDDEVVVKLVATGMCHTDLSVRAGHIPIPATPCVLGHEGAGIIVGKGEAVGSLAIGDHVILSFASCGGCSECVSGRPARCATFAMQNLAGRRPDGSCTHSQNGAPLNGYFFGQSSFATHAIVKERHAVKVPRDVPLEKLAPLGCGIQTGAGAVLNVLQPKKGSSIVIYGAGAVGLSAVMAARYSGCGTIIAVDVNQMRLQLAKELGATYVLNPHEGDAPSEVSRICGGGADVGIEASGVAEVIEQAIRSVRPHGTLALLGAPRFGAKVTIDAHALLSGVRIQAVIEGDSSPKEFIPRLVELYLAGHLPIDRLERGYTFEQIEAAAKDSESGEVIKPVIRFPD
jgi:aryl-alcohol dehydrogenase